MTGRDIYVTQWNQLWQLFKVNAVGDLRIEEGWLTEDAEVVQIIYRQEGFVGRQGLRRLHPLPQAGEDPESFWEQQAYQDVWDMVEPHDVNATVIHDGIQWFGHTGPGEDLTIQGRRFI